jgi:hypothetical protein
MNQFGTCQPACNTGWIKSPPKNVCVECKYQFGVCKWKCDPGYIHDTTAGNVCKTCYDMVRIKSFINDYSFYLILMENV